MKTNTNVVLIAGNAITAPVYQSGHGHTPSWSGRIVYDLKLQDIEDVHAFCMEEAWEIGYDDGMSNREERVNPFHRNFLHGIPYSVFGAYYARGRNASQKSPAQAVQLFARIGVAGVA